MPVRWRIPWSAVHVRRVAIIREPFLAGPYMQLLAVTAPHRGRGVGTTVLSLMQDEAVSVGARNLWICTSDFNSGAERLYRRFGFEHVAVLDALMMPGIGEVLMRKRLFDDAAW
jgi:GNAT superfamily N-acetyltransferase